MSNLPRLSGALRAFTNPYAVETPRKQGDLTLKRKLVAKKTTDGLTWENLTSILHKEAEASEKDIKSSLKDLCHCAREIGMVMFTLLHLYNYIVIRRNQF